MTTPHLLEDPPAASADAEAPDDLIELEMSDLEALPDAEGARRPCRRLGELLVEAGLLGDRQLREALAHQRAHGGKLGSVLVALGMLDEAALESQLSSQLGIQVCDVDSIAPDPGVLSLLPEAMMRKHQAIPLRTSGRALVVGMTEPSDRLAVDEIIFASGGREVVVEMITEATFRRFLATRFPSTELRNTLTEDFEIEVAFDSEEAPVEAQAWEVEQLARFILENAVRRRASDVHIEPYEDFCRVRVRVDGVLYTLLTPPRGLLDPLIRRFKLLSGMKGGERNQPQDGQVRVEVSDKPVDLRISTLPTLFGEKAVIRLLTRDARLGDLSRLGFRPDQLRAVRDAIREPQGLVLVTGPTGSGKSTTLRAMLNEINDPDKNIVTLEDPVEGTIPGINHVPVSDRSGPGYAKVLRSILRQDPDVVLVGEIREPEVAEAAVKAAMTGHLVISSLHTNGVAETFLRLRTMGVAPWLLSNSLQLVLGQRLLRRTCTRCSRPAIIPPRLAERFALTDAQLMTASRREPDGCPACLRTGYRGRVAVFESLRPNDALRAALRSGGDEEQVRALSAEMGIVTLGEAGVARALAGETTFAEVRRRLGS